MKLCHTMLVLVAGLGGAADQALAGWWGDGHYIGHRHDAHFNNRFLQRPCPPYHGWNRPLYGWSSNYRPYYFTPQPYANTPWAYGPAHHAAIYETAAPTVGLNAYGVPVQSSSSSQPASTTPTSPPASPTPAVPSQPAPLPAEPTPEVPPPPMPSLE